MGGGDGGGGRIPAINLEKRVSLHGHVLLKALRAVLFDYLRMLRFPTLETHFRWLLFLQTEFAGKRGLWKGIDGFF